MTSREPRRPPILARLATLVVSTVVALGLAELGLRLAFPGQAFVRGRPQWNLDAANARRHVYDQHDELGFIPVLDGEQFDEHAVRRNDYAYEKRPDVTRLLFVGDSVTARGRIVRALQAMHDEGRFEFWNAGVEGYNTWQEVELYRRWNHAVAPDHVILTFHNNDFELTPVTFLDGEGQLVVYAPRFPLQGVDPWFFRNSHLYRLLTARLAGEGEDFSKEAAMRATLAGFRDELAADGIRLSLVVFPVLEEPDAWNVRQQRSRERILRIADQLGLRTFDLMPALEHMLAEEIPMEEQPGDPLHPNNQAAIRFAAFLKEQGLLTGG